MVTQSEVVEMREPTQLSPAGTAAAAVAERPWRLPLDFAVIAVCMACIFAFSFSYPTLFPEYAWVWSINVELSGWDVLAKYTEFDGGWYKPTEHFAYYSVLGRILNWHSVFQFRVVTLLQLYGLALLIYGMVRKAFPRERVAALLAAVLFVAHPTHFSLTIENLGTVLLYAMLVLGSALCFLSLRRQSRWASWAMLALGIVLYVLGLTCREQAVALPSVLVATYVIDRISRRGKPFDAAGAFVNRLRLIFLAIAIVITAIYWRVHVMRMVPRTGGYRTVLDWFWLKRNAIVMPQWLVYYFSSPDGSWLLRPSDKLVTTLFGAALVLVALGSWGWALRKTPKKALTELAHLMAWTLGFLAIPIYSGGEPWHVLLPVAAFCALYSVALVRAVGGLARPGLRVGLVALVIALATGLGAYNFRQQFLYTRPGLYELNEEAVLNPPVPRESMPRGALVYYNSMGLADWNFGNGHLFDFVYLDPQMKQRGVQDGEGANFEIASDWLAAPHAFYFAWRDHKWRDETSAFRPVALGGVKQALSQCVAARQCDEVAGRLKTIVAQHPELGTLKGQLDCLSPGLAEQPAPECQALLGQTQL